VQHLAVDTQAEQHVAVGAGPEPELVAVPAAGEGQLGRRRGERGTDVGVHGPAVAEPARRHHPAGARGPVWDDSPVQQQLPEPGHVAGGGAQAPVVHGCAPAVMQQAGVVLGAHRRPHQRGDQLGHGPAGRALAHPAQHVGLGRAVQEPAPVRRLGAQRGQEPVQPAGLAGVRAVPADPLIQAPDIGLRIGVLLTEPDPAAHVQHVPYGGAGVAAGRQFGNVAGDGAAGVELAAVDEHGGHAAHHGLGHRHQRVRPVRCARRAVPLGDQLAVLQHHVRVGEGIREDLARRAGRTIQAGDGQPAQVRTRRRRRPDQPRRRGGQRAGQPAAPGHQVGRQDLIHMPERPAVNRRVLPVVGGDRRARGLRLRLRLQRHSPHPS
jgi:hypothetical protein